MISFRPRRSFICLAAFATAFVSLLGQTFPSLQWQTSTAGVIFSSPAIDQNGVVYVGSNDNSLHAFHSDGTSKWTYATGNWVDSTPTIGGNGVIYVGSWDNKLHAVNSSNGSELWTFETNNYVTASPVVGSNGLIYFGSKDSVFYALEQDGSLSWEYFGGDPIFASAAIGEDGTLYFGDEGGLFHALNPDGTVKWTYQTEEVTDANNSILSAPAIDNLGNLYFGCGNGYCYSLSDAGESASLNWKYLTGDRVDASPVLGLNDEVFFAGRDGYLRSLPTFSSTTENVANWEALVGDVFYSSPVVDANGRVYTIAYTGGGQNHLFCYDTSGNKLWDSAENGFPFSIDGVVDSSLALTDAGTLYFGCYDSKLYCVNLGTGLASSAWPSYQRSISRDGAWPSYSLSVTVTPSGSGLIIGTGTFAQASDVTLTAQASVHHLFSRWLNGSTPLSSDNPYTLSLGTNLGLTAEFVETFNLNVSSGQGGAVSPSGAARHVADSSVTIEATPDTGYSFSSWEGAGVLSQTLATTQVTMSEDREISASFSLNSYTLSISSSTGGSASESNTYNHGTSPSILATPSTGYHFNAWTGAGITDVNERSTTVLMTEDRDITANFQLNSYTLNLFAGNGGTVSAGGSFDHGTNATISATPNTGYSFHQWTGSGVVDSSDANSTVQMTENRSVSATFQINSYDLNITSGVGGTIEGNGTYEHGQLANISAAPNPGFVFSGWTGASVAQPLEPSTTIEMTSDSNLTASFIPRAVDKVLLIISETPSSGGSTIGGGEYDPNATVQILASPQVGYSFTGWDGNFTDAPSEANTTLQITTDLNITANFTINSYSLIISSSIGGSTSGSSTYNHGVYANISATPQTGYFFNGWSGMGINDPTSQQTTTLMTEDRNLSATFSIHTYDLSLLASEGGSVTGASTYDYGTLAPIVATPSTGYTFSSWAGTGVTNSTNPSTTVEMTDERTLIANFAKIPLSFTITSMEGGSASGSGTYDYGSNVALTAEPSEGYKFSQWEGSAVVNPNSSSTTLLLTEDSAVTAIFERLPGYWNEGWLGFVLQSDEDWMYVHPLGWMFSLTSKTKHDYWLWHSTLGWLWLEKNTFSNSQIWMNSENSWIFIDSSDWQKPKYYNYGNETWNNY